MKKLLKLDGLLNRYGRVLVAFSGGVDSSFLLARAVKVLGVKNVLAATAVSETYPEDELDLSRKVARKIGARQLFVVTRELKNRKFSANPRNRCFYCKDELFSRLSKIAGNKGMALCDGTNASDAFDFRPGRLAARKWGVRSPMLDAGLTKDDIRKESRKMRLPTWNLPAQACLASRFPYGSRLSAGELEKVEKGEKYLKKKGFRVVRIRHHGETARIETGKNELGRLLRLKYDVSRRLKRLGWGCVTVDPRGYRTGSLNASGGIKGK
ncbi:MAG: ATP-dependent sacrificial sulfur transferase LarE [Endomicrobiales bacterium]|nr:ATP-dependent sacrificial sulfur transferase LarE [Endomicrobiales bacterium]